MMTSVTLTHTVTTHVTMTTIPTLTTTSNMYIYVHHPNQQYTYNQGHSVHIVIIIIMDPALTCYMICVQVYDNPAKHKTIASTYTHTCNKLCTSRAMSDVLDFCILTLILLPRVHTTTALCTISIRLLCLLAVL